MTYAAAMERNVNLLERRGAKRGHQMGQVFAALGVLLVALQVHVVQDAVGGELHLVAAEACGVELLELGLALVVLVHVLALQSHTGVRLVNMYGEICTKNIEKKKKKIK